MNIKARVKFNMQRNREQRKAFKQTALTVVKRTSVFAAALIVSIAIILSAFAIYKGVTKIAWEKAESKSKIVEESKVINEEPVIVKTEEPGSDKVFNISVLGEIMMGGESFNKPNETYMIHFKNINDITKKADYTIATLGTNISNLKVIEDASSKYVVTRDISNAFNALGIDALNIATDHAVDFGKKQFDTTTSILKEDNIDIVGLTKDIVYAESGGIRVAFISLNNAIIGNVYNYTAAGINVYDRVRNKAMIAEAKKNADTVIAMPHYGKENAYAITDSMREVAKRLIDDGADMIIGSHALGVYPIEEYKGKQIIYSAGYFMHDTNYEIGKQAGIFNISINEKGEIFKTEMLPTYIDENKEVKLYKDVDLKDSADYLKRLFVDKTFSKYEISNEDNKLVVELKK